MVSIILPQLLPHDTRAARARRLTNHQSTKSKPNRRLISTDPLDDRLTTSLTMTMIFSVQSILPINCIICTAAVASAFVGTTPSHAPKAPALPLGACPAEITSDVAAASGISSVVANSDSEEQCWASHALLFSSLSDGLIPNTAARSFLRYSLAKTLLREHIINKEDSLKSSVEFSPCNGLNVESLNNLESVDELFEQGQQISSDDFDKAEDVCAWTNEALQNIISSTNDHDMNVRVLYIPTAMYALNPQSSNTAGKQRQRARADGKKRRTQLLNLLDELLSLNNSNSSQFNLLATTLDLDDGSLKQPVGSEDASLFPQNDKAALSTWQPHLIYVEGGNTFWLQHCIDKGDYSSLMKDACVGESGAVYCGKSAGAIVAGSSVATATWKGWDNPSVVPGKETYDDWLDCQGFQFVDRTSIFPHMGDD